MALMLMVLLPCTGFSQFRVAKFLSFFGAARTQILVITRNQSLLWCSKFMLCNDFLPWIGFTNVRKLPLSNSLAFRVFPTVDDVEGIYIVQMFLKKGSANRRNCFYYIMKHSHEENSNNFDFREPWCFSSLKKKDAHCSQLFVFSSICRGPGILASICLFSCKMDQHRTHSFANCQSNYEVSLWF